MTIRDEIIDELLAGQDPQAVFARDGLLDALKKALAERVLNAELDHHNPGRAPVHCHVSNQVVRAPQEPIAHCAPR